MKRRLLCALLLFAAGGALGQDIAVRGGVIYPVTAPPIDNGVVLVEDGRIAALGPARDVRIPEGVEVVDAAVVTPGLIDAHVHAFTPQMLEQALMFGVTTVFDMFTDEGFAAQRPADHLDDAIGQMREVAERLVLDLAVLAIASAQQMRGVVAALVVAPRSDDVNCPASSSHVMKLA